MGRHKRFLLAFALGAVIAGMLPIARELRALTGANAFFLCYLALMLRMAQVATPDDLRRHAEQDDEGIPVILLLALTTVLISLTAIYLVLNGPTTTGPLPFVLALAAVPMGWAMVQVLAGFHYAHLFYRPETKAAAGGLSFPGAATPGAWDFLYFAFTIGMTAQVSDVTTTSAAMRRVVLFHAVGSFFYNTVILALAVNAAVTAAL